MNSLKLSNVKISAPLKLFHLQLHLGVLLLKRVVSEPENLLGLVILLLRHAVARRGLREHGLVRVPVVERRGRSHQWPTASLTVDVNPEVDRGRRITGSRIRSAFESGICNVVAARSCC